MTHGAQLTLVTSGAQEHEDSHIIEPARYPPMCLVVAPAMAQISGYDDWMFEQGQSTSTRQQRLRFVDRLLRDWGTLDVSRRHVIEWLSQYEGWTYQTYFNHLTSVYDFLVESSRITESPLARVRRRPDPGPNPKPLSAVELGRVLDNCSGDLEAWLHLAFYAGLRAHEIAKIRGEDITASTLHVLGKGRKVADLPTHTELWNLAKRYPRRGWWFPSRFPHRDHISTNAITGRVGVYFRRLNIETGSIHRLRHSYATTMDRNGFRARVIQDLMRHSSLNTTQRYLEVAGEEKRRAIDSLGARSAA
jgi:integrase/recombinase XerD